MLRVGSQACRFSLLLMTGGDFPKAESPRKGRLLPDLRPRQRVSSRQPRADGLPRPQERPHPDHESLLFLELAEFSSLFSARTMVLHALCQSLTGATLADKALTTRGIDQNRAMTAHSVRFRPIWLEDGNFFPVRLARPFRESCGPSLNLLERSRFLGSAVRRFPQIASQLAAMIEIEP